MTPDPITPAQFDAALLSLGWKGTDFCDRAGLVPNTVWRWRKGTNPIPLWVGEYLRALLALQRLHGEFVAIVRPGKDRAAVESSEDARAAIDPV